jgi:hypothetical protein
MERLEMTYTGEFEHPDLPPGDALRTHVLYRARAQRTLQQVQSTSTSI